MILWGPPGVGKTTLAGIIAKQVRRPFYVLTAVSCGVKEVREVIEKARQYTGQLKEVPGNVLLFIDEIHTIIGAGATSGGSMDASNLHDARRLSPPNAETRLTLMRAFDPLAPGADVPERLLRDTPVYDVPFMDENGDYLLDLVHAQDIMNWVTQGPIADRTKENLGASDVLISEYRRLLKTQIDIVRDGGEPMNVFRDPATIESPELGPQDLELKDPARLTVVAFFSSWCPHCNKEMPRLNDFVRRIGADPALKERVRLLGVRTAVPEGADEIVCQLDALTIGAI